MSSKYHAVAFLRLDWSNNKIRLFVDPCQAFLQRQPLIHFKPLSGVPKTRQVEPIQIDVLHSGKLDFKVGRDRVGMGTAVFALDVEIMAMPFA